jgi:hypothetical protein
MLGDEASRHHAESSPPISVIRMQKAAIITRRPRPCAPTTIGRLVCSAKAGRPVARRTNIRRQSARIAGLMQAVYARDIFIAISAHELRIQ